MSGTDAGGEPDLYRLIVAARRTRLRAGAGQRRQQQESQANDRE